MEDWALRAAWIQMVSHRKGGARNQEDTDLIFCEYKIIDWLEICRKPAGAVLEEVLVEIFGSHVNAVI